MRNLVALALVGVLSGCGSPPSTGAITAPVVIATATPTPTPSVSPTAPALTLTQSLAASGIAGAYYQSTLSGGYGVSIGSGGVVYDVASDCRGAGGNPCSMQITAMTLTASSSTQSSGTLTIQYSNVPVVTGSQFPVPGPTGSYTYAFSYNTTTCSAYSGTTYCGQLVLNGPAHYVMLGNTTSNTIH